MKLQWTQTDEYLIGKTSNFKFKNKLAMFDLDKTLIIPKIGNKKGFPIDENDWKFLYSNTKSKLIDYDKNDYSVIIISNQGGVSLKKQNTLTLQNKLNQIHSELNMDIFVFFSIAYNKYRKPIPTFVNDFCFNNCDIDRKKSFYCGDACGRSTDFSDTDYKFSLNCMLKFRTPENVFLNDEIIIPKIIYPDIFNKKIFSDFTFEYVNNNKELIIMVGYAGSGKSYISNQINTKYNYIIINQDTLKTKPKCIKMTKELLNQSKSIIIDRTNPSKEDRKIWIDLGKKYNYKIKIIELMTSRELSKHNNYYRNLTQNKNIVPEISYRIYCSKYEIPSIDEGCDEIIQTHCNCPNDINYYYYLY
jgi:bifunctional polynucleotide phosphatase/kinase